MTTTPPPRREIAADLRQVRDLLAAPERWTRKAFARKANGEQCNARSDEAVCWCIEGACLKLDIGTLALNHVDETARSLYGKGMERVNDDPTLGHAAVLALLDAAIVAAEKRAEGVGT